MRIFLSLSFQSPFHPFSALMATVCDCYNSTYGGVRVHPRLLSHAVQELSTIVAQIYGIVTILFPALPRHGTCLQLDIEQGQAASRKVTHMFENISYR